VGLARRTANGTLSRSDENGQCCKMTQCRGNAPTATSTVSFRFVQSSDSSLNNTQATQCFDLKLPTKPMEQNPSWKADSRSHGTQISHHLPFTAVLTRATTNPRPFKVKCT
jgi:hypothetical protein